MKLYKVIKNNQSCNGGNFDWTEYLPQGGNAGKWTPVIENIKQCQTGYHVTPFWNMWFSEGCEVYECEVNGLIENECVGVINKYVCKSVRLIKKLELVFDSNTGNSNTGYYNTKDRHEAKQSQPTKENL